MENPHLNQEQRAMVESLQVAPPTKLDALRTLSKAYWYVRDTYGSADAASLLDWRFNVVRRSMSIQDLMPRAKRKNEGFNGRMPRFF